MENKHINTFYSFDTEYSADSVEWCPHQPNQHVFVCANYYLVEKEGQSNNRLGRILLFALDSSDGLKLIQKLNTPAILDQKWCPRTVDTHSVLGVANANGSVEIYRLTEKVQLEFITSLKFDGSSETLVLSLDWSRNTDTEIVCSDSKGNVHLIKFHGNDLTLLSSYHAHDFEAWITGFYYQDSNVFFSGGDDCLFYKYDNRVGTEPVSKNKSHEAGVTSLHSHSSKEHLISTGSYDEHIRLWDIRNIKQPISTKKMPGTLWRLKWDPRKEKYLLTACMLGGIHIVTLTDAHNLEMVGSHHDHKNIAYGADWCHMDVDSCRQHPGDGDFIIGTCSFYDHLLCVSKFDNKM